MDAINPHFFLDSIHVRINTGKNEHTLITIGEALISKVPWICLLIISSR